MKLSERMRKGGVQFSGNGKLFNEWIVEVAQLGAENAKLKRENEALRDGISFIIADSLGDDTSVDWIRIQLNRLLTAEEQEDETHLG